MSTDKVQTLLTDTLYNASDITKAKAGTAAASGPKPNIQDVPAKMSVPFPLTWPLGVWDEKPVINAFSVAYPTAYFTLTNVQILQGDPTKATLDTAGRIVYTFVPIVRTTAAGPAGAASVPPSPAGKVALFKATRGSDPEASGPPLSSYTFVTTS